MTILAIDSSLGTSVALVEENGEVLAEHISLDTRGHIENIGGFLSSSMQNTGLNVSDISAVAVGIGPAPFTGLRVGIAAAKAFCVGADIPLLPVSSHHALAYAWFHGEEKDSAFFSFFDEDENLSEESRSASDFVLVTDAKRRELFMSPFSDAEAMFSAEPTLISRAEFAEHPAAAQAVTARWLNASSVGKLALAMQQRGIAFPEPQPIYLRPADVTLSAKHHG